MATHPWTEFWEQRKKRFQSAILFWWIRTKPILLQTMNQRKVIEWSVKGTKNPSLFYCEHKFKSLIHIGSRYFRKKIWRAIHDSNHMTRILKKRQRTWIFYAPLQGWSTKRFDVSLLKFFGWLFIENLKKAVNQN